MPSCRNCGDVPLRPVRWYTCQEDGRTCLCAVFCLLPRDTPALLRWLESREEPVLGLRRSSEGIVTVFLGTETGGRPNG